MTLLLGLAHVLARDSDRGYAFNGAWFWPSRVEHRPEWAAPLDNGWGTSLQVSMSMTNSNLHHHRRRRRRRRRRRSVVVDTDAVEFSVEYNISPTYSQYTL